MVAQRLASVRKQRQDEEAKRLAPFADYELLRPPCSSCTATDLAGGGGRWSGTEHQSLAFQERQTTIEANFSPLPDVQFFLFSLISANADSHLQIEAACV